MKIQAKTVLVNLCVASLMIMADSVALISHASGKIVYIALISSLALLLVTNFPVKFGQRIVTAITLTLNIMVSLVGGILASIPVKPISQVFTGVTLVVNFIITVTGAILIEAMENLKSLSVRASNNLSIATIIAVTTYADVVYHCQGLLLVYFALPMCALLVYLEYKIAEFNNELPFDNTSV